MGHLAALSAPRAPSRRAAAAVALIALATVTACQNTTTGQPAPSSSGSSSAEEKIAGPPGGPVPKGFVAKDLTFVSTRTGWLLGTAPCTVAPCTSIVRTIDSGRTWIGIPAPRPTWSRTARAADANTPLLAVASGDATKLYRGTGAGASWTVVATVPAAAPTDGSLAVIGFEDARTGRFAPGTNAFPSMADAG